MRTIRFKQRLSESLGHDWNKPSHRHGFGPADHIAHAEAEIDEDGRVIKLMFFVTTGNGRLVDHPKTIENAKTAVIRELARRVELNDQALFVEDQDED